MLLVGREDGMVTKVNRRASELLGTTGGSSQARSLDIHIGPFASQRFRDALKNGGFVDDFETQFTTDYGETFWALLSGQVVHIGDDHFALVGVNDITEAKRVEKNLRDC
jgi:PAS domain S-box-containing protein